jgi:hypothetical protein
MEEIPGSAQGNRIARLHKQILDQETLILLSSSTHEGL